MSDDAPTLLDAIQAVESLQERRVALWHEYDDAMNAFFAAPPIRAAQQQQPQQQQPNGQAALNGSAPHSCADAASHGQGHGHQASIAPDAGTISEITRIVASGLLEAGHELRAVQVQLQLPLQPTYDEQQQQQQQQQDPPGFGRPDLARVLDRIQTGENALLKTIVERDQHRRTEHLRSGADPASATPPHVWFADARATIRSTREEIQEAMQELAAEKAELALA